MSSLVPGTGISVVTDRLWSLRLYYQLLDGPIEQSKHLDGVWTNEKLTFSPVPDTPLASITYNSGKEVSARPSHISGTQPDGYMCRFACTTSAPTTRSKSIATLKNKAGIAEKSQRFRCPPRLALPPLHTVLAYSAMVKRVFTFVYTIRVSAVCPLHAVHLLIHLVEPETNNVVELANDGYWHTGDMRIGDALGATDLAAVAYYFQNQTQIRVYYQARDLSLKEYGHNNSGWFKGQLVTRVWFHPVDFNRHSSKAYSTPGK